MKLSMCTCERINFKMVKTYLKKLYLHLKDSSMDIKKSYKKLNKPSQ